MPASSLHVASELLRRISNAHTTLDASRSWISEHQKEYANLRLSWGVCPPCAATVQSPWLATLTPSQRSALTFMQYKLIMSQPKLTKKGLASGQGQTDTALGQGGAVRKSPVLMLNLAPSLGRIQTSKKEDEIEISACIVPNQCVWVHLPGEERIMLGREALMFEAPGTTTMEGTPFGQFEKPMGIGFR